MVDALRAVCRAVVPGGLVLDLHPVRTHAPVAADGAELPALDDSAGYARLAEVDRVVAGAGDLMALEAEASFTIRERFDDVAELVEAAQGWRDTIVPPELKALAGTRDGHVDLPITLALRRFRAAR